jgi:RNA polymerase sigma factor (TIGR02999 family)
VAGSDPPRLTELLRQVADGDPEATSLFYAEVYEELRSLARARLRRERQRGTLQTTALVNDAYLRLLGSNAPAWEGRRHFFGAAVSAMRRILIDRARQAASAKHGGEMQRVTLVADPSTDSDPVEVLALDEALQKLEQEYPRKASVVRYRYFLGLSIPEVAEAVGITARTVDADWKFAKAWLRRELVEGTSREDEGRDGRDGRPQEPH